MRIIIFLSLLLSQSVFASDGASFTVSDEPECVVIVEPGQDPDDVECEEEDYDSQIVETFDFLFKASSKKTLHLSNMFCAQYSPSSEQPLETTWFQCKVYDEVSKQYIIKKDTRSVAGFLHAMIFLGDAPHFKYNTIRVPEAPEYVPPVDDVVIIEEFEPEYVRLYSLKSLKCEKAKGKWTCEVDAGERIEEENADLIERLLKRAEEGTLSTAQDELP